MKKKQKLKVVTENSSVPLSNEKILDYIANRPFRILEVAEKSYRLSLFSVVFAMFLLVAAGFVFLYKPPPKFFLNDISTGRIIPVVPVSEPNMNHDQVRNWFKTATIDMLTFSYANYREVIGTKWREAIATEKFNEALKEIRPFLNRVIDDRIVLFAVPASEPVIKKAGKKYGVFTYLISMNVILAFDTGEKQEVARYRIDAKVRRVDVRERAHGLEISWFAMSMG